MNAKIGAERGWPPMRRGDFEREAERGSLYVGSPETVARRIASTAVRARVARFDLKYSVNQMPHDTLDEQHRALRHQGHSAGAGPPGLARHCRGCLSPGPRGGGNASCSRRGVVLRRELPCFRVQQAEERFERSKVFSQSAQQRSDPCPPGQIASKPSPCGPREPETLNSSMVPCSSNGSMPLPWVTSPPLTVISRTFSRPASRFRGSGGKPHDDAFDEGIAHGAEGLEPVPDDDLADRLADLDADGTIRLGDHPLELRRTDCPGIHVEAACAEAERLDGASTRASRSTEVDEADPARAIGRDLVVGTPSSTVPQLSSTMSFGP